MRTVRRRMRRGEKEWREILGRFESSGLGSPAFCRQAGVSPSSLQRWRKRLSTSSGARFVELVPSVPPTSDRADWALELQLPHGIVLRMRA